MSKKRQKATEGTHTQEEPAASDSEGEASQAASGRLVTYSRQARDFAKEHPTVALVVAASAGFAVAAEFAAGAVVGIGATALLAKRTGPEVRRMIRERGAQLWSWGRQESGQLFSRAKQLLPIENKPDAQPPAAQTPTQPASV